MIHLFVLPPYRLAHAPVFVPSFGKGYFGGGYAQSVYVMNKIDGLDFMTEAALSPSATLSVARVSSAGVSSASNGYFGGGSGSTRLNKIERLIFATEVQSVLGACLSQQQRGIELEHQGVLRRRIRVGNSVRSKHRRPKLCNRRDGCTRRNPIST